MHRTYQRGTYREGINSANVVDTQKYGALCGHTLAPRDANPPEQPKAYTHNLTKKEVKRLVEVIRSVVAHVRKSSHGNVRMPHEDQGDACVSTLADN